MKLYPTIAGKSSSESEILRSLSAICEPGQVIEIRSKHGESTESFISSDHAKLAKEAVEQEAANTTAVWFTFNPLHSIRFGSATDKHVRRRRWLLIDVDSIRPQGVEPDTNATDAEHEAAHERARGIRDALTHTNWPAPIYADSGNGAHLLYRIDLTNDDAATSLISGVLHALSKRFSDDAAKVDASVSNPARVTKLYGTVARKGPHSTLRTHRQSRIIDLPEKIEVVPEVKLKELAGQIASPKADSWDGTTQRGNLEGLTGAAKVSGNGEAFKQSVQSSVIDTWNAAHHLRATLEGYGYTPTGGNRYKRPGGASGSVNLKDGYAFHHSSNDPMQHGGVGGASCKRSDSFDLFVEHEHGGNRAAAVADAAQRMGMSGSAAPTLVATSTPAAPAAPEPIPYKPFPLHLLPPVVANFIHAASEAMRGDPVFVAMPMLAALASAIGSTRQVMLKKSWCEPSIIWACPVTESGSLKSPGWKHAVRPTEQRQNQADVRFKAAWRDYEEAAEIYANELKEWKGKNPAIRGDKPQSPVTPAMEQTYTSDATTEAMAAMLAEWPRGILLSVDELSGWLNSFGEYKGGMGGDVARWLSFHSAGTIKVDRKGSRIKLLVPRAVVSVTGGIQPKVLRKALGEDNFDNGLAARFLMAMPPKQPKVWTDDDISDEQIAALDKLFNSLFDLPGDGNPLLPPNTPATMILDPQAKGVWIDFYNRHNRERDNLAGNLQSAWAKLEAYAARLAMIIHVVRHTSGERVAPFEIDAQSMLSGIGLVEWFGQETKRIYAMLDNSEPAEADLGAKLIELFAKHDNAMTVREIMRCKRLFKHAGECRGALNALEKAGAGRWEYHKPGDDGGRPLAVFHLFDVDTTRGQNDKTASNN